MKKRVVVFLPSLAGGGAERSIVNVANGLAARGLHVDLVAASLSGEFVGSVSEQVKTVDLGKESVIKAIPALVQHLRQSHPDAVLSAMSHANIAAICAHRIARSRSRLILSERSHLTSMSEVDQGALQSITRQLVKWLYPFADGVIAVSEGVAEDLRSHVGKRPHVVAIYNPIVTDELVRQSQEPDAHPWLSNKQAPVILAAGRLSGQKDFMTLLRAFSEVRRRREARLIILGEGPMREALQALAQELGVSSDFSMPGFAANPFSAMAACDLFVLSSRYEGLPGVLIQAMACGAPVVSTDCHSGPREILEDGVWGALTPVGDVQAMARAIDGALDLPGSQRPDVRLRANDFSVSSAIESYACELGL